MMHQGSYNTWKSFTTETKTVLSYNPSSLVPIQTFHPFIVLSHPAGFKAVEKDQIYFDGLSIKYCKKENSNYPRGAIKEYVGPHVLTQTQRKTS